MRTIQKNIFSLLLISFFCEDAVLASSKSPLDISDQAKFVRNHFFYCLIEDSQIDEFTFQRSVYELGFKLFSNGNLSGVRNTHGFARDIGQSEPNDFSTRSYVGESVTDYGEDFEVLDYNIFKKSEKTFPYIRFSNRHNRKLKTSETNLYLSNSVEFLIEFQKDGLITLTATRKAGLALEGYCVNAGPSLFIAE